MRDEEKRRKEEGEKERGRASTPWIREEGRGDTQHPTPDTQHQDSLPSACDRFAPELKAYQDRQLGWWERWRVERHLARCFACREEMQAMRDFSRWLQEGEGETLSPHLRARILSAVPETAPAAMPIPAGRNRAPRPLLVWGAAASALLLCLLLPTLFLKGDRETIQVASKSITAAPAGSAPATAGNSKNAEESAVESAQDAVKSPQPQSSLRTKTTKSAVVAPVLTAPTSQQEVLSGRFGGTIAGKSALENAPGDKSISGENVASTVTNTAPASEKGPSAKATLPSATDNSLNNSAQAASRATASQMREDQENNKINRVQQQNRVASNFRQPSGTNSPRWFTEANGSSQPRPLSPPAANSAPRKSAVRSFTATSEQGKAETGDILLLVSDVEQSRATLEQAAKSNGGVVTTVKDITYPDNTQAAMLTLDVPTSRLPTLLEGVNALGEREPFDSGVRHRRMQFAPTRVEAKQSNDFDASPSNARVQLTIHLQEKPKR